jgi:parallel beta-helix repeat protein
MQGLVYRKSCILAIVVLFIGVSIVPSISGSIGELSTASLIEEVSDISFKFKKTHENDIASYDDGSAAVETRLFDTGNNFGKIIYVDDDNTEGPWDGTQEHPYQYIQDAIDNASDGDTIYVKSGTYYRNEIVDKTVNLFGENRDTTIVDGRSDDIVYVTADGVKTLIFPLGTEIKQIDGNEVEIRKASGLKDGQHVLFLCILSKEITRVRVIYELPSHPFCNADEYDFLIITPTKWKDVLEPLVKHKEKYGIHAIIVSLDEIYSGKYFDTYGKDEAEQIKYFIKDGIECWGIKYVMLVGGRSGLSEKWLMPIRYSWLNDRSSSWEYERRFISDLYYADIYDANGAFSSWDSNNNGYYAEYDHELNGKKLTDDVDLLPDVYLGRLPARSRVELKRVVNNIIQYENTPDTRFNKIVLCGGDFYLHDPWDIAEGEYLLDAISEQMENYNVTKIYASQELNAKKINEAINEGADIVVFEGAGNPNLWGTHAKDTQKWIYYDKFNILQLKNKYLPVVLTSGARIGRFTGSKECFNWFFVSKGKAIASIGSTGLCWIGHGANVTEMFLGNLHIRLCKKMAERRLLGDAWGEAIEEYLCNFTWRGVARAFHMKAAEELELFGDPTLKIGGYKEYKIKKSTTNNVLHVSEDGYRNYTKIQDNLNNAGNGSINVYPNVYYENLCIDKSLTIIGNDAKIKTDGITLLSPYITIKGFSIEGNKKGDGLTCYGDNALIENNTICFFNTSIFVSGDHCLIKGNEIRNSECGVWFDATEQGEITDNSIKNNWYGVWGEYASNTTIADNNFSYNEWYAVWMEGVHGNIIGNNFSKNWYPIYLYNSHYFSMEENTITLNIHGPQFVNSSFNLIERNVIKSNEHYGAFFGWRSKKNEITHNDFIENANNARDDGSNTWDKNYWSDYIGLKINLFYLMRFPYYIKQFSFDWHPAKEPYDIDV